LKTLEIAMNNELNQPPDHKGHVYEVEINGRNIALNDKTPQGGQLLAAGGYEPVDEYVLIKKMKPGTRLISLDETVELSHDSLAQFFAFKSGEVFMFTVNTHGYQWGQPTIQGAEIRDIADVPHDQVILLLRDEEPRLVMDDETVSLNPQGTEHFRTESRQITVYIDKKPKEIDRGTYTTEQLLTLLDVEAGYLLTLQRKDGLDPMKPGQKLKVEPGMCFFSQAPGGGSS
jgi:hypothetical protein